MFGYTSKDVLTLENVVAVEYLSAFAESKLPEHVLRSPVGRFGERNLVTLGNSVLKGLKHKFLPYAKPCEPSRNSKKLEMEHLAGTGHVAAEVKVIEFTQNARDRLEFLV